MLALHRKYRPQTVDELDQAKIRKIFDDILKSGVFSQAYLFTGPKGTGKTTAARVLAKIVNCEKNKVAIADQSKATTLVEPCNSCDACLSITAGSSTGVVEIDAASNRGIDDIRSLRDQINFVPADTAYAVYIIDEVHMLTTEAFNALLKTLEEPPAHAIFCLATTELHKLPETVVSRCTVVRYTKSSSEEIKRSLKRVVSGEKITIDDKSLELIAEKADGSFRDAVNIVQSVSAGKKSVTLAEVSAYIGSSSQALVRELLASLHEGDVQKALAFVEKAEQQNEDMESLAKAVISQSLELNRSSIASNKSIDTDNLLLVDIFSQAFKRFSDVPIPSLPLEMAIIEYCLKTGDIEKTSSNNPPVKVVSEPADKPVEKIKSKPQLRSNNTVAEKVEVQTKISEPLAKETSQPSNQTPVRAKSNLPKVQLELDLVHRQWPAVLEILGKQNHGLTTVIKRGTITDCADNVIILSVGYEFHKQQLEQERYVHIIEECLAEAFGGLVRLEVQLEKAPKIKPSLKSHQNISGSIPKQDTELVSAVEEVFGV